jgi:D-methionine transport system permease protein
MFQIPLSLFINATIATIYMVFMASVIATLVGLPLGVILYITRPHHILEHRLIHQLFAMIVNVTRSIPFIILMIAVIPLTRKIIGTSIGTQAAIVPLSLCAMPFVARIVENALLEVNKGLIEAATAMGATHWQIITKVLMSEALPGIINGLTLTLVTLIGYSAMAGAIGGGGLGDLAIRYGYQRFDTQTMMITIIIIVILVQAIQYFGDKIAKKLAHVRG